MLIDTHAHLYWDSFKSDFDQMIGRAPKVGVDQIINVGVDLESSQEALKQAQEISTKFPNLLVYSSIGIHPHEASKINTDVWIHEHIEKLVEIYQENPQKVVAVGECGLDYYFEGNRDFLPSSISHEQLIKLQRKLFRAQIDLSKKLGLPLLIHCRDAWSDIFEGLEGTKGVFHTFSSTKEDAQKALDLGYHLSFSCIVTYPKNEALREIIKNTPLDKILTETDSPFLPPQDQRGTRNEPANVAEVVKTISQIKNLSPEKLAKQIEQNTRKLFSLK
ncbi:TatD family hydrolase [Candidatus Daviesbacteria bacterium]|nr:TatD family hydrolase [Candidatus Daviesbacteria bacterium]